MLDSVFANAMLACYVSFHVSVSPIPVTWFGSPYPYLATDPPGITDRRPVGTLAHLSPIQRYGLGSIPAQLFCVADG